LWRNVSDIEAAIGLLFEQHRAEGREPGRLRGIYASLNEMRQTFGSRSEKDRKTHSRVRARTASASQYGL
jgi:hypothetical protein